VAVTVKTSRNSGSRAVSRLQKVRTALHKPWAQFLLGLCLVILTVIFGLSLFFHLKYSKLVDSKIKGQIFSTSAKIYATPRTLRLGDTATAHEIGNMLRRSGYAEEGVGAKSNVGMFRFSESGIVVTPGAESYHNSEAAHISFDGGKVSKIRVEGSYQDLGGYELEPQLVTALFEGEGRSKRRLVQYSDVPKVMVDAVVAIEDRRFFTHGGVNYFRLAQAAWIDFRSHQHQQGASTITMQLARGFFLTPEKTVKRKIIEMMIASELESKLSKQQIFEMYANQVDMGQRGSFTITGFGQAAQAYFGKDIKNLTLPEAALLAAIIQRPSWLSPYRHPDRALERRNVVLDAMVETDAITRDDAERAKATPLKLAPPNVEASDAPYFVDLVKDVLTDPKNGAPQHDLNEQAYRIYTSLDMDLQKAAAEAVESGIKEVDKQVNALRTRKVKVGKGKNTKTEKEVLPGPKAQVALIAIDPHTGEVLALVGGRNYGDSQLNHAVAERPTGSIFKPFVYAAAINTGLAGTGDNVLTPASVVDDSATTFNYGDQIYEPRNYKEEYHGPVRLGYALALSLNNATVKVAEAAGYDKVAELARNAGIKRAQATPAVALGSYDATPLDMAGAWTVFANYGVHVNPIMVKSLRAANGDMVQDFQTEKRPVLDPRVAYVMTDMLQGPVNFGTAAGIRGMGFTAQAAGKTGTSHDAWFAGYTTNLLCIVWVGYDDYSDLKLSGAATAAPIWAQFMKKALVVPQYKDPKWFSTPAGVVTLKLDKITNRIATPACPDDYYAAFIAGTEPKDTCEHVSDNRNLIQKIFGLGEKPSPPPPVSNQQQGSPSNQPGSQQTQQQQTDEQNKKKPGFWKRIFGGGDDKDKDKQQQQQPAPQPAPH
jgi:penicillin-binding protein 1B